MKPHACLSSLLFVCLFVLHTAFDIRSAAAQNLLVSGSVRDAISHEPLIFAHILVEESGTGVVTSREGDFRLHLPPGVWTLRVSFIGYRPETRRLTVHADQQNVDFALRPQAFDMPEVTVTPDDSLARLIIRRVRERRIEREKELRSYHMRAHSKVYSRIDSTRGMSADLSAKLTAYFMDIGETQTESWFAQPDQVKVLIHARRQSDLFENLGNRMHSGFAQVNFSAENLKLGKSGEAVGPISEAGLEDVYWYSVAGVAPGDLHDVYRIRVLPKSTVTPAVSGYYYIEDSTWSVTQVELELNPGARAVFLPIAQRIRFRQQFSLYGDRFWMPSAGSVGVQAKVNAMGSEVWLNMEASSVIAEYEINPAGIDTVFDEYRVEVLPLADKSTDEEWEMRRLQPASRIDSTIYRVSDSMAVLRAEEMMEYNVGHVITGKELQQDKKLWSLPGIVNAVRFNRVEGLALALPYASENQDSWLRKYAAEIGYGFLDRRLKGSASARFALGGRDPWFFDVAGYHDMSPLFRDEILYGDMMTTMLVLFGRYDKRDYFYRRGGDAALNFHPLPWLEGDFGMGWIDYRSAEKHTDWSLEGEGIYRENPRINDGGIFSARLALGGDFRGRTLEANGVMREKRSSADFHPVLGVEYLRTDLDAGQWETLIPHATVSGRLGWGILGHTDYRLSWARATNTLPVQQLLSLAGSEPGLTSPFRFRTARIGDFGGDERAVVGIEHNFGTLPFSWMGLPEGAFYAAEMWELRLFASAGWTRMRAGTETLLTREMQQARLPLVEAGLSINNLFGIMRLDVGHRLTHLGSGSNFFIGISIAP
ncbi:MAG: carboxypeptidase-like regulatory domain-containing protein [Bacteroidetes bacterium]|nr:carboxypeptidase-like regulatory domain-containing protein [Bacteroidota bacterium]